MNYTKVTVYFTNGTEKELNYVTTCSSPEDEYRFRGQTYNTNFAFVKRNVTHMEMVR